MISSPCPLRSGLRSGSEQGKVLWLIPYLDALWNFNHLFTYTQCDLFRLGHAMPYMNKQPARCDHADAKGDSAWIY